MPFSRPCSRFALLAAFLAASVAARAETTNAPRSLFSVSGEPPKGFSSESEAGISLVSGNTRLNRTALRSVVSYRWTEETVQGTARYLQASADEVENANLWSLGLRYERRLIPRLGGFVGQFLEADKFAGFRQRYSTDIGVRKTLWRRERTMGASELGYRYQLEHRRTNETVLGHIIRAFVEASYRFNPNLLGVVSIEGLPNVKHSADWMANVDFALQTLIEGPFALKTSYGFRYDHRPAGPKRIDSALTSSLVAKF